MANENYQVFYNKYRPKTFQDVVGQNHITTTLQNEIKSNRIAHSYLFVGTRGTGKTTCARIFAKAVNCQHPNDGNPCGECEICKSIADNMDILELDAASNNGVEDMRDLQEKLNYTPTTCKYRVVIIDEVHMLSNSAFNSLLKIVEEPPAHVIFILATTEVDKIPATIISRCQRFDFKRINNEAIADRLEWVMQKEDKTIDRSAAMLIAKLADGGMRDALSLLESVAYLDEHISEDRVRGVLGLPDTQYLTEISHSMCKGESANIMRIINTLSINSRSMTGICNQLITFYRDMMLVKMRGEKDFPDYVINEAKNYTAKRIIHIIDSLNDCYQKMLKGNERCFLEVCLLQMAYESKEDYDEPNPIISALEARVSELENMIKNVYGTQANKILAEVDAEVKKQEEIQKSDNGSNPNVLKETISLDKKDEKTEKVIPTFKSTQEMINYYSNHAEKFDIWTKIAKTISLKYKNIGLALENVAAYEYNGYVLIKFDDTVRTYLQSEENKTMVKKAIEYVTKKAYKIGPYIPTAV